VGQGRWPPGGGGGRGGAGAGGRGGDGGEGHRAGAVASHATCPWPKARSAGRDIPFTSGLGRNMQYLEDIP